MSMAEVEMIQMMMADVVEVDKLVFQTFDMALTLIRTVPPSVLGHGLKPDQAARGFQMTPVSYPGCQPE